MKHQRNSTHQITYDAVFQHPIARNLAWREVVSMLASLEGASQEQHRGTLKVTRNGRTLVLHQPIRKNMTDAQELMNLRRFLEQSEAAQPRPTPAGAQLLVVSRSAQARDQEFLCRRRQDAARRRENPPVRQRHRGQQRDGAITHRASP
jgi:hypothetical protein